MIDQALLRHAAEFTEAIDKKEYDVTETGFYVPATKANIQVAGEYTHFAPQDGLGWQTDRNIVVNEGLLDVLSVYLKSGTQKTAWYLSLFGTNYTPVAALTAATYPATAGEITSGSEGYSESVRQTWTGGTPASNLVDNTASMAVFTIVTATSLVVYGAGMHSVSTKGGTTGVLLSASKFTSGARTLYNGDAFNLSWRLTLSSS